MKKAAVVLSAIAILLGGCGTTLTKVERKYGPPGRVEIECVPNVPVCDENTYFQHKELVQHIYWFYFEGPDRWQPEMEWIWEIKADRDGNVLSKREYIGQKGMKDHPTRTFTGPKEKSRIPGSTY